MRAARDLQTTTDFSYYTANLPATVAARRRRRRFHGPDFFRRSFSCHVVGKNRREAVQNPSRKADRVAGCCQLRKARPQDSCFTACRGDYYTRRS